MTKHDKDKLANATSMLEAGVNCKEVSKLTGFSLPRVYQIRAKIKTKPNPPVKELRAEMEKKKVETTIKPVEPTVETPKTSPKKIWKGEYIPRKITKTKTDWDIAQGCWEKKKPLLITGEAGCGKSYLPKKIAEKNNQSFVSVNCNRAITPQQLLGQLMPVPNKSGKLEIKWIDGILTRKVKEGGVIVLEEVNSAPPEVLFIIHGLLEDNQIKGKVEFEGRKIQLLEKEGEIVTAHPDFWLCATMNPNYEGTISLNLAFKDRFRSLPQDYNEKAEDIIIGNSKIQEIAKKLRVMFKAQEIVTPTSTRNLMAYMENLEMFDEETAQYLFVAKYEESEQKAVNELFNLIK